MDQRKWAAGRLAAIVMVIGGQILALAWLLTGLALAETAGAVLAPQSPKLLRTAAQVSGIEQNRPCITLTGRPCSASFLRRELGIDTPSLQPGEQRNTSAGLVRNLELPEIPTQLLAFSDHPERVSQSGLLFDCGLIALKPVRLQYYHQGGRAASDPMLRCCLANRGKKTAIVHVIQGGGGPDSDYFVAGHRNSAEFLQRLAAFEGRCYTLAPGQMLTVSEYALPIEEVVSHTQQMTLLEGSEVSCYLFSLADAQEPISYNLLYKDGDVHARGVYPAVDQHVQRTWNIAHNDNYLAIGAVRQPNMYAGPELKGDYGVVYYIDLLLYNKQEYAQNVELLINPRGGKATATVVGGPTEGQQSPHAVWELAEPVEAFEFARLAQLSVPGQSVFRYKLMTMPEGASNYPVRLVLRKVGEVSH